jgi:cell wall-associated NlpC family hydrolase
MADLYRAEFGDGGRGEINPGTGRPVFDCWGLVMAVMERLGVTVPDFYEEHDDAEAIGERFDGEEASGKWERMDVPEAPCVIAIKRHPRAVQCVSHFGVYVGGGKFLHILKDRGVHLDPLKNLPARQLAGFWRWRG